MSAESAETLIEQARSLRSLPSPAVVGVWQRATAFLARQALELTVRQALMQRARGAERTSARAQFLCLPEFVSTPVALEASYIWAVLTRACHQHPYELAPTWSELDDWLLAVERLSLALDEKRT
jgi:hypothetical protein